MKIINAERLIAQFLLTFSIKCKTAYIATKHSTADMKNKLNFCPNIKQYLEAEIQCHQN